MVVEPKVETVIKPVVEPVVEPVVPVVEPVVEPAVETPEVSPKVEITPQGPSDLLTSAPITDAEGEARSITEDTPVEEPSVEPEKPATISRELAEKRINRMYARYKAEQDKNRAAPVAPVAPVVAPKIDEYGDPVTPATPTFTKAHFEALWDQKEKQRQFRESEVTVIQRHPEIISDDGEYDLNSEFVKAYMEIGRTNPQLTSMVNGPELAEAMVEKQLGLLPKTKETAYKAGKVDAAKQAAVRQGAHTGKSTVAVSADKILELSDEEKNVADKLHISRVEYSNQLKDIKAGRRTVRV